jgi:hypothetical protein
MKRTAQILAAGLVVMACLLSWPACTKSPFGETEISGGSRQIRGQVELDTGQIPKDVYVWLEGFNVGARTDQSGRFEVALPPESFSAGTNGAFNLYFYLANFALATTPLTVRNGSFVYGQGEIGQNGELNKPKLLSEILHITTVVTPASVARTYRDTISVRVMLRAFFGPVKIVFPKSFVDNIGALFFRQVETGEVLVVQLFPGIMFDHTETIGRATRTASAVFDLIYSPIPPGKYEVIPYLLVQNDAVPPQLIAGLGENVEALSPNYLKIPFSREGGSFEVK